MKIIYDYVASDVLLAGEDLHGLVTSDFDVHFWC